MSNDPHVMKLDEQEQRKEWCPNYPEKTHRVRVVIVFHYPVCQSYGDAKVSSIKYFQHANHVFMLFDASEIEDLDRNI